MATQITKQFDHEKGKFRDKAFEPDYRERILAEGDHFDRGGTHGNRIVLADIFTPGAVLRKCLADDKQKAWRVFESKIRSLPCRIGDHIFCFKDTSTTFAKSNNLSLVAAQQLLPTLRQEAEARLEMTKRRLLAAAPLGREELNLKTGRLRIEPFLTFRTFLVPITPQPWRDLYKKLRLDPIETEPEGS